MTAIGQAAAGRRQQGAVLITALMILLLMTIFGVSTMDINILEERMAGNMRDRNMAFQAAESALRQAEQWLASQAVLPALGTARGSIRDLGSPDATNDGLPWWTDQANRGATWWAANGVFNSGANLIPGVDTQPAYIIEKLPAHPVSGEAGQDLGAADIYLQITARGVGRSPNTVVLLQSIYKW